MKIYTRTGDEGETSLFGGKRVAKDDLRIDTYGTVDELNSVIGICRSMGIQPEIDSILEEIQKDLFALGAELATPGGSTQQRIIGIQESDSSRLERHIDAIDPKLTTLKNFIVPGGTQPAAMMHYARTVCRRAERRVVRLANRETVNRQLVVYLNRLSDLLFVVARRLNQLGGVEESPWRPDR